MCDLKPGSARSEGTFFHAKSFQARMAHPKKTNVLDVFSAVTVPLVIPRNATNLFSRLQPLIVKFYAISAGEF